MGSPGAAIQCGCARSLAIDHAGAGRSSSAGFARGNSRYSGAPPPRASALSSSHSATFSGCQGVGWRASVLKMPSMAKCRQRNFSLRINAMDLGDFGARDPTKIELESNFNDKILGHSSTEHVILIPSNLWGLSEMSCKSLPPETPAMTEDQASTLMRKVVGWRLENSEEGLKIWTEWKLKDSDAVSTLFDRISAVAEAEGQSPDLRIIGDSNVARAELSTKSIGGLSVNDFIFAAKIDKVKTSDLVKKRFWA